MFFDSKIKLHSETAADALEDSLSSLLKLVKMPNFHLPLNRSKCSQVPCDRKVYATLPHNAAKNWT